MKDSGQRTTFDSGAQKEMTEDKSRVELIPGTALLRLGKWYKKGAEKYEDWNWAKGIPLSVCLGSLLRHAYKYQMGDRSEDHPAAMAFWANAIMHFEDTGRKDLDDLPDPAENLMALLEKNLEHPLTSAKNPPTIGRDWKVEKAFTTDDGTDPIPDVQKTMKEVDTAVFGGPIGCVQCGHPWEKECGGILIPKFCPSCRKRT